MDSATLYRRLAGSDITLRLLRLDHDFLAKLRENYLLFSYLDDQELERLFRRCIRKVYRPSELVFQQGESGTELFLVVTGTVKIVQQGRSGLAHILATLKDGDVFGEMAIISGTPRSASAIAETDCVLFAVDEKVVRELDPEVALKFYKYLALELGRKLETANSKLDELFYRKAGASPPAGG